MTTQDVLTLTAEVLVIGFAIIMTLDFTAGIIDLWNNAGAAPEMTQEPEQNPMTEGNPLEPLEETAPALEPATEPEMSLTEALKEEAIARSTHPLEVKLILDEPLTVEEVKELARVNWLKGWHLYRKQTALKKKLYPALC